MKKTVSYFLYVLLYLGVSSLQTQSLYAQTAATNAGREIVISNQEERIAGTLLTPAGDTRNIPLVILISGSGAQSRDSQVFGFPIFARMAEDLRQAGIASFRFDDRDTGQSTGDFREATLDRLAADVAVIVDHFMIFSDQKFREIILLGHSQGGIVAGRLASLDSRIDKVVLVASSGMNMRRILRQQVQDAYMQNALPPELVEEEIKAREEIMYAIADETDVEAARDAYSAVYRRVLEQLPREARAQIPDLDAFAKTQGEQLVYAYDNPQLLSFLFHDPVTDLRGLKMPVLMIFGEKDTQVIESLNRPLMEEALKSAGSNFTSTVIADANHLMQRAVTGQVMEYLALETAFAPGVIETIAQWVRQAR